MEIYTKSNQKHGLPKGQICIVDDEPGVAEMLKDYLKDTYDVSLFLTPESAIEAFDSEYSPDLLVTDLKMPQLSGLDLAMHLYEKRPGIPIVMMSGYATKQDVIDATGFNVQRFLEKPFEPDVLKVAIHHALEKTAIAARLRECLLTHDQLLAATTSLCKKYFDRFIAAENRVYDLNLDLHVSQTEVREFIKNIGVERNLENQIERLQVTLSAQRLKIESHGLEKFTQGDDKTE